MVGGNLQIINNLKSIDNFFQYGKELFSNDEIMEEVKIVEQQAEGKELLKMEIKSSVFKNNKFTDCNFEGAAFFDVEFNSCDFSNSKFLNSYFCRCEFSGCKCMGIDMSETIIKNSLFENCDLSYSNFDEAKLTDVNFKSVNFTEGTMTDAKLKKFVTVNSKFVRNNFFKTMLQGVDFSDNEIIAPLLSNPPIELHGATVNMFQAADLIRLWGIIVKP